MEWEDFKVGAVIIAVIAFFFLGTSIVGSWHIGLLIVAVPYGIYKLFSWIGSYESKSAKKEREEREQRQRERERKARIEREEQTRIKAEEEELERKKKEERERIKEEREKEMYEYHKRMNEKMRREEAGKANKNSEDF